jgi:serine/threonine-protein kinase RsbW
MGMQEVYPTPRLAKRAAPAALTAEPTSQARRPIALPTMAAEVDPTSVDDDLFEVIVPLRTRYASTLRMIAASLGAEAGFNVDEIDDMRLALDEVFSLLADRHAGERVRTAFRLDGDQLIARLSLESGPVDVEPDELAANILRSVVDSYQFASDGVTLSKQASES